MNEIVESGLKRVEFESQKDESYEKNLNKKINQEMSEAHKGLANKFLDKRHLKYRNSDQIESNFIEKRPQHENKVEFTKNMLFQDLNKRSSSCQNPNIF